MKVRLRHLWEAVSSGYWFVPSARIKPPGRYRHDKSGKLRLVLPVSTFDGVVDLAFNQLRQYGRDSVAVTIRLLEVIRDCAMQITCDDHRQALLRHALMIYRQSQDPQAIPGVEDRADVQCRWEAAVVALGAEPADYALSSARVTADRA